MLTDVGLLLDFNVAKFVPVVHERLVEVGAVRLVSLGRFFAALDILLHFSNAGQPLGILFLPSPPLSENY